MAKRYRYKLALEEEAEGGRAALWMAAISGLLFLAAVLISFVLAGKAGIYVGTLGLTGILMAAAGFITGLGSFKEKHKNHRSSTAGSLINGVLAVLWLALFLIGVS
ncbi:hypothetical protein MCG98_08455 [Ruminococcus sp. OA3]|uniref:hypothetical protein n=1 Tax=Ruminococcus sp. OA3 TaxID=2914164 RepID=UPI001F06B1EC|nr:hypothetical protein [Ruminococcus sp. OA3]MCH1982597.1 hypothetical protein [Ruminococcus sp. OA3]